MQKIVNLIFVLVKGGGQFIRDHIPQVARANSPEEMFSMQEIFID